MPDLMGQPAADDGVPAAHRGDASADHASEVTPEIERKFVHQVYDAIAPHFSATRFAKWPKVAAFLEGLPAGSLVLDAGCGNGKYLGFNATCQFIGVDISAPLVKICRGKGHEVGVADAMGLPFRNGTFDAVISIAVLHHLSTPARRRAAIEELLRVVKPGGQVLITVWAREQENQSLLNKWTPLVERHTTRWVDGALVPPNSGSSREGQGALGSSALDQVSEEEGEPTLETRAATTGSQAALGSGRGVLEASASSASCTGSDAVPCSPAQSSKEGLSRNLDRFTERWVESTGSSFSIQVDEPKSKSASTSPRTPGMFSGVFKDVHWPPESPGRGRGPDSPALSEGALESPSAGRFLHGPSRFGAGKVVPAGKLPAASSLTLKAGMGLPGGVPLLRSSSGSLPGQLSRLGSEEVLPSFKTSAIKDGALNAKQEGLAPEFFPLSQRSLAPASQSHQQKLPATPGAPTFSKAGAAAGRQALQAGTAVPLAERGLFAASDTESLQLAAMSALSPPRGAAPSSVFASLEEDELGPGTAGSAPVMNLEVSARGGASFQSAPQHQQHQHHQQQQQQQRQHQQVTAALLAADSRARRDGRALFTRSKSESESQLPVSDTRQQSQALPPRSPAFNLVLGSTSGTDSPLPQHSSACSTPRAGLGASAGPKGLPPISPGGFGKRPPPSVVLPGSHGGTPVGSPRGGFPPLSPKSPLAKACSVGGLSSSLGGTPLSSPRSTSGLPPLSPRSPSSTSSAKAPSMFRPPRSPRPRAALASPPSGRISARPTSPLPLPLRVEASSHSAGQGKAEQGAQLSQGSAGAGAGGAQGSTGGGAGGAAGGLPPQSSSSPARSPLRRALPPRPTSPLASPAVDHAAWPISAQTGLTQNRTSSPHRTPSPGPAPPPHRLSSSSSQDSLASAGLLPKQTSSPLRPSAPLPAGLPRCRSPLRPFGTGSGPLPGLPPRSKSPLRVELNAADGALDEARLAHAQSMPALPSGLLSAEAHVEVQNISAGIALLEISGGKQEEGRGTRLPGEGPGQSQAPDEALLRPVGLELRDGCGATEAAAKRQEDGAATEGAAETQAPAGPAPQEYLVPWHLPMHRVDIASDEVKSALDSGFARKDNTKGSVVYNRFYHVFTQGELERLAGDAGNSKIVDKFYDKSNWCIVMQKN